MIKRSERRPAAEAVVKIATTSILLSPASSPTKRRITALVVEGWCVHDYHGPKGDGDEVGGFSISRNGLSLNALCPDVRWDVAIRIALRLGVDFPDPDFDDPDTQWAVISAVAESLVES